MKLIVAPHVDDDVIGCGGMLDKSCYVWYCGVDEFHGVSQRERLEEARAVADQTKHIILPVGVNAVNSYKFSELKNQLENIVNNWYPDEIYLPWPSYNQDHQSVYRAAQIALRPHDKNHFVKRVLLYEEPDCFWPGIDEAFKPNFFRPIDIDRKLNLYNLMKSQVRGHRSEAHIEALARVRGAAINVPFAEAFHILRWVE